MTLLYYDPVFTEHQTGDHPERAARILPLVGQLNSVGLADGCSRPSWEPASVDRLCQVHTRDYLSSVEQFACAGGGQLDADTVVSQRSYDVASIAAGAACDAVQRVLGGEDTNAFCIVRPPGHHAMPDHAMGFCLLNNVAVAARVATGELGLERVLIVDFDVHHGNGTQAMFWEDAKVAYFSMHRAPFYPGTGSASEVGAGKGRGTTLNLPISFGTSRQVQISRFRSEVVTFARQIRPQLVLVSAGFDSHKNDPIGSLGLESDDFLALTRVLLEVADEYADRRLVSVLEGGYNPDAVAQCGADHLQALLDAP